jgi:uncharacterized protein (DUF1501 family)
MPISKHLRPRWPVSRRDFLAAGGLTVMGLSMAERAAMARAQEQSGPRSVILVVMTGGPSHLDTFDPKPDAPREIRGPMRTIQTALPGVAFTEAFPRLAERAEQLTVLRSLHHTAAPIHETGLQLLQTGRLVTKNLRPPSIGSLVGRVLGPRRGAPAHVLLPGPIVESGVVAYRGDRQGDLGEEFAPQVVDSEGQLVALGESVNSQQMLTVLPTFDNESYDTREAYGATAFGRRLWQAKELVERGVRFVTVNLCEAMYGRKTFDAHGDPSAPATVYDYRDSLGPHLDRGLSALLDDLQSSGLLQETMVVCTGEFGRTPRMNAHSGRDHWPHVWSGLVAGAGAGKGQVIGASDRWGESIIDRPIALAELAATMADALRISHDTSVAGGDVGWTVSSAAPVAELIG